MQVAPRSGVRRASLVGVERHYEPMDLLYEDEAALDALVQNFAAQGRTFAIGRVREDSPTVAASKTAFTGTALVKCRQQVSYPFIDLDASWAEPEQNLSSGRRSDLRRAT